MTQTIDTVKLKAAAEHLEWVLRQYPDSAEMQALLHALGPLIDDAKAGLLTVPIDTRAVPGTYDFADGAFIPFRDPGVGEAYANFRVELGGGLTEQDKRRHAEMEAFRQSLLESRA